MLREILRAAASWALILIGCMAAWAASPTLEVRGRVELPGGGPAAGARLLVVHNNLNLARHELQADADGQFAFVNPFHEQTVIIARSSDEKLQRRVSIAETQVRAMSPERLRIDLRPARQVRVRVTRDDQAVGDVRVAVDGAAAIATTNSSGEVQLLVPDPIERTRISAWHAQLGIGGAVLNPASQEQAELQIDLTLHEPQPRRVRVVDQDGQPVPGLLLCPNFKPIDGEYFVGRSFGNLSATTDAVGEVEFVWAPKKLQYVNFDGTWLEWTVEKNVQPTAKEPTPVVHVRRKRTFAGRLIVPPKCDPTGLLIAGQSFGPSSNGDYVAARAAADGSFSLTIAPEHDYAIAVCDREWTSAPSTGVLARQLSASEPAVLELRVEPATPLTIQATIGANPKPLADAYVSIGRIIDSQWVDAQGNKHNGRHNLSDWIKTDENGMIRCGLGRGQNQVFIVHENWREEKTLEVKSAEPVTLAFHKPYEHRRQIRGQLAQSGRTGNYSRVKITAVEHYRFERKAMEVIAAANGRFEFSTDCQKVEFFALDWNGSVCGNAVAEEIVSSVTIDLRPTASYEGEVLNRKNNPLQVVGLTLALQAAPEAFVRRITTDADGRFFFDRAFSGLPLRLATSAAGKQTSLDECYLEPGEKRQGVRVHLYPDDVDEPAPRQPLVGQWPIKLRDARLARMHVLVAIHGDDPQATKFVSRSVLDYEAAPAVLDYLPIVLSASAIRGNLRDDEFLKKVAWPMPAANEVVLVAADGSGKLLGTTSIAASSPTAAADARQFLDSHRPPAINADDLWRDALAEAKRSDRRVLVQIGGPRCGPCFLLSRWTDDHHDLLERDYVVLKLHVGRYAGAAEIEKRLRARPGGIPWMAIVDAEGNVLATGDGPLGNIGFPSSFEGLRHFQRMLEKTARGLTAADISELLATLRE